MNSPIALFLSSSPVLSGAGRQTKQIVIVAAATVLVKALLSSFLSDVKIVSNIFFDPDEHCLHLKPDSEIPTWEHGV